MILISSYVVLWILVVFLSVALMALAKQIGLLHRRLAPVGARITNVGPSIGDSIPSVVDVDIEGNTVTIPSSDNRHTAIVFVSSTCPACDELAPALRSIAQHERAGLRIVLASFTGDKTSNQRYVVNHALGHIQFLLSPSLALTLNVSATPYAIIVDSNGVVITKGLVNNREHFESLLNAVDESQEGIQAFQFGQVHSELNIGRTDVGTGIGAGEALSGD